MDILSGGTVGELEGERLEALRCRFLMCTVVSRTAMHLPLKHILYVALACEWRIPGWLYEKLAGCVENRLGHCCVLFIPGGIPRYRVSSNLTCSDHSQLLSSSLTLGKERKRYMFGQHVQDMKW